MPDINNTVQTETENYIHKLFSALMDCDYPGVAKASQELISAMERSKDEREKFLVSLEALSPELFELYSSIEYNNAEIAYLSERDSFTVGFEWGAGLNKQLRGSEND